MNNVIDTINTCLIGGQAVRTIVYYSHIVPIALSLALAFFVFFKARFNLFSKVFLLFVGSFSLWLVFDLFAWNSLNYNVVYTAWSFLDFIEIIFYILGLYFVILATRKSDINIWEKIVLFAMSLPAFIITVTGHSVLGFNQPICEAFNNDFLGTYKIIVEGVILALLLIYAISPFFKTETWAQRKTNLTLAGSMFLFLAVFGATEYFASVTGVYEVNLYSLFLLPVLLVAIIYSVFELDIFNFHILGTHYLVVGLMILTAGQLFFITNTTYRFITILTIILVFILSIILFRNLRRESDQRTHIEKLNVDLQELIKQRESLVHLVTHKVKGSFTRTKYIFAGLVDGTFGDVNDEVKKWAAQGLESDNIGIETVDLVLNASNLQKGTIKYDMKNIDFREIVEKTINDKKGPIEAKGLQLIKEIKDGTYTVMGDPIWLKEIVHNFIENSTKYTKTGSITVGLEKLENKVRFSVKDTGIGITDEDKKNLFTEGGRGKDSVKTNVDSTGYGLYSVKLIVQAHNGKVWAESEGPGKGSQFYLELDAVL